MSLCPSCGAFPVKRLEVICELCQAVSGPVHIRQVLPVVMAEIENRKEAA